MTNRPTITRQIQFRKNNPEGVEHLRGEARFRSDAAPGSHKYHKLQRLDGYAASRQQCGSRLSSLICGYTLVYVTLHFNGQQRCPIFVEQQLPTQTRQRSCRILFCCFRFRRDAVPGSHKYHKLQRLDGYAAKMKSFPDSSCPFVQLIFLRDSNPATFSN